MSLFTKQRLRRNGYLVIPGNVKAVAGAVAEF